MQELPILEELKQQRLEAMRRVVADDEAYNELLAQWITDEVKLYLLHVAGKNAEAMLKGINERTIAGYATDFHERLEMTIIERIVDDRLGNGSYRKAMHAGELEKYITFETGEVVVISPAIIRKKLLFPYYVAHPQALRAEMEFVKTVAAKLGVELSAVALVVARPDHWKEIVDTKKTIQNFYSLYCRKQNLRINDDQEDTQFPIELPEGFEEELQRAQQFYLDYGATYEVLPMEVLKRNGLRNGENTL